MNIFCKNSFFTYPILLALQDFGVVVINDFPADFLLDESSVVIGSPLDFLNSREKQSCSIVSHLGSQTTGFAGINKLVFNSGLKEINSVAYRSRDSYEKIIAEIILTEKYDSEAEFIEASNEATLTDLLNKNSSVLAVADIEMNLYKNYIDLTDEWEDITETPLIHTVCFALNNEFLDEKKNKLNSLCKNVNELIAKSEIKNQGISYMLDSESLAGLDNFFKFCFYYGLTADLPQSAGLVIL